MKVTDEMVNRFLSWPLPESVCADLIATKQGPGRIGTNLLTATEAKQMLEHVLAQVERESSEPDWVPALTILMRHRRQIEISPGVGAEVQRYALACCDDIANDLRSLLPLAKAPGTAPSPAPEGLAQEMRQAVKDIRKLLERSHQAASDAMIEKCIDIFVKTWERSGIVQSAIDECRALKGKTE